MGAHVAVEPAGELTDESGSPGTCVEPHPSGDQLRKARHDSREGVCVGKACAQVQGVCQGRGLGGRHPDGLEPVCVQPHARGMLLYVIQASILQLGKLTFTAGKFALISC